MASCLPGDSFDSFEELKAAVENYSKENFVQYTIVDSLLVATANKKLSAKTTPFEKRFYYRHLTYQCKLGSKNKESKKKGQGIRPNQRTYNTGCGAHLYASIDRKTNKLVIHRHVTEHNHELRQESFHLYPEQRRLPEHLQDTVKSMLSQGVQSKAVQNYLAQSGKPFISTRDISNMRYKLKQKKEGRKSSDDEEEDEEHIEQLNVHFEEDQDAQLAAPSYSKRKRLNVNAVPTSSSEAPLHPPPPPPFGTQTRRRKVEKERLVSTTEQPPPQKKSKQPLPEERNRRQSEREPGSGSESSFLQSREDLEQWTRVGDQHGLSGDGDIAHFLLKYYTDTCHLLPPGLSRACVMCGDPLTLTCRRCVNHTVHTHQSSPTQSLPHAARSNVCDQTALMHTNIPLNQSSSSDCTQQQQQQQQSSSLSENGVQQLSMAKNTRCEVDFADIKREVDDGGYGDDDLQLQQDLSNNGLQQQHLLGSDKVIVQHLPSLDNNAHNQTTYGMHSIILHGHLLPPDHNGAQQSNNKMDLCDDDNDNGDDDDDRNGVDDDDDDGGDDNGGDNDDDEQQNAGNRADGVVKVKEEEEEEDAATETLMVSTDGSTTKVSSPHRQSSSGQTTAVMRVVPSFSAEYLSSSSSSSSSSQLRTSHSTQTLIVPENTHRSRALPAKVKHHKNNVSKDEKSSTLDSEISSSSGSEESSYECEDTYSVCTDGGIDKPFSCNACGKRFSMPDHVKRHYSLLHTARKAFQCGACGKKFTSAASLRLHGLLHTGQQPFSCPLCGKAVLTRLSLTRHMATHSTEGTHRCEVCGKTFTTAPNLHQHKKIHNADSYKFVCDVCGKAFCHSHALKKHRESHRENKFACDVCKASFTMLRDFNEHRKQHPEKKTFACDQCDRSYTLRRNLYTHQRSHDPRHSAVQASRFHCDSCGKSFGSKAALKKHAPVHSDKRPFSCDVCTATFKTEQALKVHKKTPHSDSQMKHAR